MTEAPGGGSRTTTSEPDGSSPVLPDYAGASISSLFPALAERRGEQPASWLPPAVLEAGQLVLLVLDGIGWDQYRAASAIAPTLTGGGGGPITSVVPTTTATALTSITTGRAPCEHGVVGYRLRVGAAAAESGHDAGGHARERRGASQLAQGPPQQGVSSDGEVLNVLQWRTVNGDMRRALPAAQFQSVASFGGTPIPAVTRSEFAATGFTALHLGGARLSGWAVPSTLIVKVRDLLTAGEPFVYAYYDGLDKVAHGYGLGAFYAEELRAVDKLIGDLLEALPRGAALVVTSDHGQVEVGNNTRLPAPDLLDHVTMFSGEGRFRWLHARPGARDDLLAVAREHHGSEAWVRTREEIVEEGWFGGPLAPEVAERLGDVALVAREPVAFLDPADTGETRLEARHGSLTATEMYVPLLGWAAS